MNIVDEDTTTYTFSYRGQISEGAKKDKVKKNLARAFQATEDQLVGLFNDQQEFVRSGLDQTTAKSYLEIFKRAGAVGKISRDYND